jgi:hypothetical protein
MGIWSGYSIWCTTSSCRTNYQAYYYNVDSTGNKWGNPIANLTPGTGNHQFTITYNGSTGWDERYDGNVYWTANHQNSSYAVENSVGLEIGSNSGTQNISWAYSATAHMPPTEQNSVGGGWSVWPYFNTLRNHACGLGWTVPNCTNGSWQYGSEWDTNKPVS